MATLISVPDARRAHTTGSKKLVASWLLTWFRNGEPYMLNAA